MTEEQLMQELSEIVKDTNLTNDERKKYYSIYSAELEKMRSDNHINALKQQIQNLRVKIMDDLINIYPSLDERKKEVATSTLYEFGMANGNMDVFNIDDIVGEHEFVGDTIGGTYCEYIDNDIHKEIEQIQQMEKEFHKIIDEKYEKIESKLSGVMKLDLYDVNEDGLNFKTKDDYDKMKKIKEEEIDKMDVAIKERKILKEILSDAIEYGKEKHDSIGRFPYMADYVDEKLKEMSSGKSI